MTESMIKRVTNAINEVMAKPHHREDVARATIKAMREPTVRMMLAGKKATLAGHPAGYIYRVMAYEALEDD